MTKKQLKQRIRELEAENNRLRSAEFVEKYRVLLPMYRMDTNVGIVRPWATTTETDTVADKHWGSLQFDMNIDLESTKDIIE